MNGVPLARALGRHLETGPHVGIGVLQRHQERHRERRAARERRDFPQRRRIRFACQIHADAGRYDDGRLARIEARIDERVAPRAACLEIDGHEAQPVRHAEAELVQPTALPCLRARPVDFIDGHARRHVGAALHEAVEPRAENHVLTRAARSLLDDQILDEARTRDDRCAKRSRELRIHVAALPPVRPRREQLQPHFVGEHVRRRIAFDMQRAPQRDARGRAVGALVDDIVHRRALTRSTGRAAPAPAAAIRDRPDRAPSSRACPSACPRTA